MFAGVKEYMTPAMQKWWDKVVKDELAHPGNEDFEYDVQVLMFHNFENVTLKDGIPPFIAKKFTPATTGVSDDADGNPYLDMTFTVSADLLGSLDGKFGRLPVRKTITYTLAPNGAPDKPWLIDGYEGEFEFGEFTPMKIDPKVFKE
jgi:hypothetical protein